MAASASSMSGKDQFAKLFASEPVPAHAHDAKDIMMLPGSTNKQGLTSFPLVSKSDGGLIKFEFVGRCVFGANTSQGGAWQCEVRPLDPSWITWADAHGKTFQSIVIGSAASIKKPAKKLDAGYTSAVKRDDDGKYEPMIRIKFSHETSVLKITNSPDPDNPDETINIAEPQAPFSKAMIPRGATIRVVGYYHSIWLSNCNNGEKLVATMVYVNGHGVGDPSAQLKKLEEGMGIKMTLVEPRAPKREREDAAGAGAGSESEPEEREDERAPEFGQGSKKARRR
jgi:hypothetical protein